MRESFEDRYQSGNVPWDHGMPDRNLITYIEKWSIVPCRALDIGCGTGENVVWLAQHGFCVTGCDLSPTAIGRAKGKAEAAGVACIFVADDFLKLRLSEEPFGFAFDRGCLHCIDGRIDRRQFAENVAAHLTVNGLWLSLIGNADEAKREEGPPQLSVAEIADAVEPCFEILSLEAGFFGSNQEDPPRCWICLMRKRTMARDS